MRHSTIASSYILNQVSNAADAIKVACDFIDLDNLIETQALVAEFRLQRIATRVGDDVLQFYNTVWHAWCSLAEKEPAIFSRSTRHARPSPVATPIDSAGSPVTVTVTAPAPEPEESGLHIQNTLCNIDHNSGSFVFRTVTLNAHDLTY